MMVVVVGFVVVVGVTLVIWVVGVCANIQSTTTHIVVFDT